MVYICWILLSISHVLKNPKLLDLECFVFLYYVESKQPKEVLYPKWIHSLSSNIVAAISGLICLKSGTQFWNGWFVSHRECMQWLGLSDTQRGEETWLDRWEIKFFLLLLLFRRRRQRMKTVMRCFWMLTKSHCAAKWRSWRSMSARNLAHWPIHQIHRFLPPYVGRFKKEEFLFEGSQLLENFFFFCM